MSLALIGLIVFQLYWINNAIQLSQERFDKDVQMALSEVSEKLERREVLFQFKHQWSVMEEEEIEVLRLDVMHQADSLLRAVTWSTEEYAQVDTFARGQDVMIFHLPAPHPDAPNEVRIIRPEEPRAYSFGYHYENMERMFADSIRRVENQVRKNMEKVRQKTEMVSGVFNDLMLPKRRLNNRIDPEYLDSLLVISLSNKGVQTDFEYGVWQDVIQKPLLLSEQGQEHKIFRSGFKIGLFQNDLMGNPSFLSVYFPNRDRYVLGKSLLTVASSLVLIAIIVFCFIYAMLTIIRQKKLSEIKNDFINNMTHEFKTPIATVALACEALQDKNIRKNDAFVERYLQVINDENKRLGSQVERVLQIATLDRGQFRLNLENLEIHELIHKVVENIRIQVENRQGNIFLDLAATQTQIYADEVHLTNIVFNLLDNANKYSPEKPQIRVGTQNQEGGLLIRISDKGIGMTKESIQRIFDKFYRVPTGNLHNVKGFGLGLAYVKTMTEAHGGWVSVQSEPNKGSTFELFIPSKS